MAQIIPLITSYLHTQKNYLDNKPVILVHNTYTCINFRLAGLSVELFVYNDTFIKVKVDNHIHTICDNIKTLRVELDRLHILRYQ
jgi:hypothetical protein